MNFCLVVDLLALIAILVLDVLDVKFIVSTASQYSPRHVRVVVSLTLDDDVVEVVVAQFSVLEAEEVLCHSGIVGGRRQHAAHHLIHHVVEVRIGTCLTHEVGQIVAPEPGHSRIVIAQF